VDSSQIKERIIFTRASSIWLGIPCAFVRNWVIPPANICTMCHFASRVGCPLLQRWSVVLTLSRIGSQGVTSFTSFPIHAPRFLTAFPSLVILTSCGRGGVGGVDASSCVDTLSVGFGSGWDDFSLLNVKLCARCGAPLC